MLNNRKHITVYREGRFTTEAAPEWWETEDDWLFAAKPSGEPSKPQASYGEEFGPQVQAWALAEDHGYLVEMTDTDYLEAVWMPTAADWLDFLTTRAGAFIGLSSDPSTTASLDRLCNLLTSFARHGQGTHVDRTTGKSDVDFARDRVRANARRDAARQQANDAPGA